MCSSALPEASLKWRQSPYSYANLIHGIYNDFQEVSPWEQWFWIAVTDGMCFVHSWLYVDMFHSFERIWLSNREKRYQFASSWLLPCESGRVVHREGRWHPPWKSWEREKTVRQEDAASRRDVPPLAKGEPFDRAESGTCSEVLFPDAQRKLGGLDNWRRQYEVPGLSPGLKERACL